MDGILCTGEARSKELERKVAGSGTQNERDANGYGYGSASGESVTGTDAGFLSSFLSG